MAGAKDSARPSKDGAKPRTESDTSLDRGVGEWSDPGEEAPTVARTFAVRQAISAPIGVREPTDPEVADIPTLVPDMPTQHDIAVVEVGASTDRQAPIRIAPQPVPGDTERIALQTQDHKEEPAMVVPVSLLGESLADMPSASLDPSDVIPAAAHVRRPAPERDADPTVPLPAPPSHDGPVVPPKVISGAVAVPPPSGSGGVSAPPGPPGSSGSSATSGALGPSGSGGYSSSAGAAAQADDSEPRRKLGIKPPPAQPLTAPRSAQPEERRLSLVALTLALLACGIAGTLAVILLRSPGDDARTGPRASTPGATGGRGVAPRVIARDVATGTAAH